MKKTCIVTGGAGFIGCAISNGLLERFNRVVVVDNMNSQIHSSSQKPKELANGAELVVKNICNSETWESLLSNVEDGFTVVHLAAETGTGQSLNSSTLHTMTNVVGTSTMLDSFVRTGKMPGEILFTSSRAVYGEGRWQRSDGSIFYPGQRGDEQLAHEVWDFPGAHHLPMDAENTVPHPTSVYGTTKLCQENLISVWCKSMNVPYKFVRLQNVYGIGQSLINPYTGIVSLFIRMAKRGESIPLYEDGKIIRDFVNIDDVARALLLELDHDGGCGQVLDIGTGKQTTIENIAQIIAAKYNAPAPHVSGKYRNGDVRHAYCTIEEAEKTIGFKAEVSVEEGLSRLCGWIDDELFASNLY